MEGATKAEKEKATEEAMVKAMRIAKQKAEEARNRKNGAKTPIRKAAKSATKARNNRK